MQNMKLTRQETIDSVASASITGPSPEQNHGTERLPVSSLTRVRQLVTGRWAADIVSVAAELGLADEIQSGPKTADEIAATMGLHAPSLHRLLRALSNFGIFIEDEDGRFGQTAMSETLRSDVPYSMRGMARMTCRPWTLGAWAKLDHTIRTGIPAFEYVHGMQPFDYFAQHPEEVQIFIEAMRSFTVETAAAMTAAYDFSSIDTLADIGGSQGFVLSMVVSKYTNLRGILFDLPSVLEGAPEFLTDRGVAHRIKLVAGNFFENVPSGADAYLLKNILLDWSDEDCVRILRSIHAAGGPGTKLLVVESIIGAPNEPQFATSLDIQMLVHLRGRGRTEIEWQNLLRAGGFRLSRTIPTASFASVIEAIRD